jgi:hypothetical protein
MSESMALDDASDSMAFISLRNLVLPKRKKKEGEERRRTKDGEGGGGLTDRAIVG